MTTVAQLRTSLDRKQGAFDQLKELQKRQKVRVDELTAESNSAAQAHDLLQQMADRERDALQARIETLVTYGLQSVFGEGYSFHLEQAVSRGVVTYDFKLQLDGRTTSLVEAHGGGVLAVVGYLLRVVHTILSGSRRLLLLDETFAHVSRAHLPAVVELVRVLSDKLGFQHVVITHADEFEELADVTYKLSLINGQTKVTRQ